MTLPEASTPGRSPLLALNLSRSGPVLPYSGIAYERLAALLATPDAPPVLWMQGAPGLGKTTAIERSVRWAAGVVPQLRGAIRVPCFPGMRLEEALANVSQFLCQLGIGEFESILLQRNQFSAKILLLFEILARHSVLIWLDDFHNIDTMSGDEPSQDIEQFVRGCRELELAGCRLLLTSDGEAPEGLDPQQLYAEVLDPAPEALVPGEELWKFWTGRRNEEAGDGILPDISLVPQQLKRNPLALDILFRAMAQPRTEESSARVGSLLQARSLRDLVRARRAQIDEPTRRFLDILALYGRPASAGAQKRLWHRVTSTDLPAGLGGELVAAGLACSEDAGGHRLQVHPAVTSILQRHVESEEPQAWLEYNKAIARNLLEAAKKTRSLWDLYGSFTHFHACKQGKEAYEMQKTFVESFLTAGYFELVKCALQRCLESVESPYREVVAGNLAIVYKNEGDHDAAIRIYKESLLAFAKRGDIANTSRVYHQIGNTYFLQGKSDKALTNYRCSMELAEEVGDHAVALMARVQIANVHFSQREFDEAFSVYQEALAAANATGNHLMATALNLQIGQIHLSRKDYSEADSVLSSAEEVAVREEDLRHLMKIRELQGVVASKTRRDDEAIAKFESSMGLAAQLGDLTELSNIHIHLGSLEENRRRYKEALRHLFLAREKIHELTTRGTELFDAKNVDEVLGSIDGRLRRMRDTLGNETYGRLLQELREPGE